jgi:transposase
MILIVAGPRGPATISGSESQKNGISVVSFNEQTDMTDKDINNWIMYHEIHQLARLGFSKAKIARHLVVDARTVSKYLAMSEDDYERFLLNQSQRTRKLSGYEKFVRNKLLEFPDTPAAQMHDWLKEHHPAFPPVSPRTVYNFVMYVRGKHNIPVAAAGRDYFPVDELPWGEQGQVDFGQYNMRQAGGGRKKVYFFVMVLSRSRMKYVWFSEIPFTSESVCQAHQQAFAFFGGVPRTVVYDLDRILVVDENMGQVLLTSAFKSYVTTAGFSLHFCRKADPESKGKVENVVGYVKKNFLTNRAYEDVEVLNGQAMGWLERTANHLPHNVTKQSPQRQHRIEQEHLSPCRPIPISKEPRTYYVRKDNTISYKSNFYSLPQGTYRGRGTQVLLKEANQSITLYSTDQTLICTHQLAGGKGKTILNTHHRRDTSKRVEELIEEAASRFTHPGQARTYLACIQERVPRYIRDHLECIARALKQVETEVADTTLAFCLKNELYSGSEFEQVLRAARSQQAAPVRPNAPIKLLNNGSIEKAGQTPQTSNLDDYETIIHPHSKPSI